MLDQIRRFSQLQKLLVLNAIEENLPEDTVRQISKLTTLQNLVFESGIDMSSDVWLSILHGLPHLKALSIPNICTKTRVETMHKVLPTLTKLTSLTILYAPQLGIETLLPLTNLQELKFENLGDCTTEEFFDYEGKYPWFLLNTFNKLQSLALWRVTWEDNLTDALLSMPNLKSLEIRSCCNTEVLWDHLPELTVLTHLTLAEFENITTDDLCAIASLPNLRCLTFDTVLSEVPVQAFDAPQLQSLKSKVLVKYPLPTTLV